MGDNDPRANKVQTLRNYCEMKNLPNRQTLTIDGKCQFHRHMLSKWLPKARHKRGSLPRSLGPSQFYPWLLQSDPIVAGRDRE